MPIVKKQTPRSNSRLRRKQQQLMGGKKHRSPMVALGMAVLAVLAIPMIVVLALIFVTAGITGGVLPCVNSGPGANGATNGGVGLILDGTEQTMKANLTGYDWWDNAPPQSFAVAGGGFHQQAGGAGTYEDPVTAAVSEKLPLGTRMYMPNLHRYFVVDDEGDSGMVSNKPAGTDVWVDQWVDGHDVSKATSYACMGKVTSVGTIIINPKPGYPVASGYGVQHDGICDAGYGDAVPAASAGTGAAALQGAQTGTGQQPATQVPAATATPGGAISPWDVNQTAIARVVVQVGQQRSLDAHTIIEGLMAAIGESTLRNLNHGDLSRPDTIGVFQIGPEHGTTAERMDPAWSAGNFYQRLVAVPNYQTMQESLAIHAAQQNADPNYYQQYLAPATALYQAITGADPNSLASAGTAGAFGSCANMLGGNNQQAPGGSFPPGYVPGNLPPAGAYSGVVAWALTGVQRQYPYSWGGGGPDGPSEGINYNGVSGVGIIGFDCSSFMQWIFWQGAGVKIPRTAHEQAQAYGHTYAVDPHNPQPGDLLFFYQTLDTTTHVAVYLGNGLMAEEPGLDRVAKVSQYNITTASYLGRGDVWVPAVGAARVPLN